MSIMLLELCSTQLDLCGLVLNYLFFYTLTIRKHTYLKVNPAKQKQNPLQSDGSPGNSPLYSLVTEYFEPDFVPILWKVSHTFGLPKSESVI